MSNNKLNSTNDLAKKLMRILKERKNVNFLDERTLKALAREELLIEAIESALKIKIKALKLLDDEESESLVRTINNYILELKGHLRRFYSQLGDSDLKIEDINALVEGLEIALIVNQIDPRSVESFIYNDITSEPTDIT